VEDREHPVPTSSVTATMRIVLILTRRLYPSADSNVNQPSPIPWARLCPSV
jgi:hypothetical protein